MLRFSSGTTSSVKLSVDGVDQTSQIDILRGTGWRDQVLTYVILEKGERKIRLHFIKGGANVSFMNFELSKKISETPFNATTAETDNEGTAIYLHVNKKIDPATVTTADGFSLTSDGDPLTISGISIHNDYTLKLTVSEELNDGTNIILSYNGTAILSTDFNALQGFELLSVTNNLPKLIALPGKVEAEAFDVNQGLQLENTSDTGGGQNIGYTNTGDYLEYRIRTGQEGEFDLELRVASAGQAGILEIQQLDEAKSILNSITVDIPVTGGWQSWQSVKTKMNLDAGKGWLKLKINKPEFNLNWIKFTSVIINSIPELTPGSLGIYPNPAAQFVKIHAPVQIRQSHNGLVRIRSITGMLVRKFENVNLKNSADIFVGDLPAGLYVIQYFSGGKIWSNKLMIE
jgi:endoglucanase